jgi:hypothetical protein
MTNPPPWFEAVALCEELDALLVLAAATRSGRELVAVMDDVSCAGRDAELRGTQPNDEGHDRYQKSHKDASAACLHAYTRRTGALLAM